MTAAEYHRAVARAKERHALAIGIDNTQRMLQEQDAATETIRNAWITSAPPLPGMRHEGTAERWRPV